NTPSGPINSKEREIKQMAITDIKLSTEEIQLLRSTASDNPQEALEHQKALAENLIEPLRRGVMDTDNVGGIFSRHVLAPGAQANYQLDFLRPGEEDINFTAFTMP